MFKPINNIRTFEAISEQIRHQIEIGVLGPGDKLPTERELAAQFGVSRNAVREALRTLESAGILGLQKGARGGAFVLEGNFANVTQSLRDILTLKRISLAHLAEARLEVMKLVVGLAVERATNADFAKIEANIDHTRRAITTRNRDEETRLTAEFYELIAEATGNPVYKILVAPLAEIVRAFVRAAGIRATSDVVESRLQLLTLMRARKAPEAIAHLTDYLTGVHNAILNRFPEGRPNVHRP